MSAPNVNIDPDAMLNVLKDSIGNAMITIAQQAGAYATLKAERDALAAQCERLTEELRKCGKK